MPSVIIGEHSLDGAAEQLWRIRAAQQRDQEFADRQASSIRDQAIRAQQINNQSRNDRAQQQFERERFYAGQGQQNQFHQDQLASQARDAAMEQQRFGEGKRQFDVSAGFNQKKLDVDSADRNQYHQQQAADRATAAKDKQEAQTYQRHQDRMSMWTHARDKAVTLKDYKLAEFYDNKVNEELAAHADGVAGAVRDDLVQQGGVPVAEQAAAATPGQMGGPRKGVGSFATPTDEADQQAIGETGMPAERESSGAMDSPDNVAALNEAAQDSDVGVASAAKEALARVAKSATPVAEAPPEKPLTGWAKLAKDEADQEAEGRQMKKDAAEDRRLSREDAHISRMMEGPTAEAAPKIADLQKVIAKGSPELVADAQAEIAKIRAGLERTRASYRPKLTVASDPLVQDRMSAAGPDAAKDKIVGSEPLSINARFAKEQAGKVAEDKKLGLLKAAADFSETNHSFTAMSNWLEEQKSLTTADKEMVLSKHPVGAKILEETDSIRSTPPESRLAEIDRLRAATIAENADPKVTGKTKAQNNELLRFYDKITNEMQAGGIFKGEEAPAARTFKDPKVKDRSVKRSIGAMALSPLYWAYKMATDSIGGGGGLAERP